MNLNILKDRFLIGTGIVIIAMVLFFVFFIRSYWVKISDERELIGREKMTLDMIEKTRSNNPTDPKIRAFLDYKQKLEKEYQQCFAYYKEIDKTIEKWFDSVILDRAGNPTEDSFVPAYNNAKNKLINESLKDHNISVVKENGEEVTETANREEVLGFVASTDKAQYKEIQKRFWIQKKLIDALISTGIEVRKCGQINIKKALEPLKIPDNLGIMIPFEITVYLPYKNVDRLFASIIGNSKGGPFLIIQHTKITRVSKQGEQVKEVTVMLSEKEQWKPMQDMPLVKVFIAGSALDFEIP